MELPFLQKERVTRGSQFGGKVRSCPETSEVIEGVIPDREGVQGLRSAGKGGADKGDREGAVSGVRVPLPGTQEDGCPRKQVSDIMKN